MNGVKKNVAHFRIVQTEKGTAATPLRVHAVHVANADPIVIVVSLANGPFGMVLGIAIGVAVDFYVLRTNCAIWRLARGRG